MAPSLPWHMLGYDAWQLPAAGFGDLSFVAGAADMYATVGDL